MTSDVRKRVPRRDLVSTLLGAAGVGAAAFALETAAQASVTGTNFLWFDTIYGTTPNLKNTVGTTDYQVAVCAGYATAGDGGGGTFYWDPTSSSGDDGGTIIVPTGSSTGRWRRIYSGALSVQWFGAQNHTDSTTAIQAAYSAAAALYGATVYFPAGDYLISSTIQIGTVATQLSINTLGEGTAQTHIIWNGSGSSAAGPAFQYLYNVGARMSGITLACNTPISDNPIGLQLAGPDDGGTTSNQLVFENCAFSGFYIGFEAGDGDACASEVVLINCEFGSCTYGFDGTGGGNTLNIWFYGCSFGGNTYGAYLGSAGNVHFWGGGSHGNTTATIATTGWNGTLRVEGFRFELTPPEIAIYGAPVLIVVENCIFITTAEVPTYSVIYSGWGSTIIRGCTFGSAEDSGWLTTSVYACSLEMVNNTIGGSIPFDYTYSMNGLAYSLFGNYYNGAWHGSEAGVLVGSEPVDNVINGTASFASANTTTVTFTYARENASYKVTLSGDANETFWVTGKSTTGFTLNSSNATSTASVDWIVSR